MPAGCPESDFLACHHGPCTIWRKINAAAAGGGVVAADADAAAGVFREDGVLFLRRGLTCVIYFGGLTIGDYQSLNFEFRPHPS